jgi:cytochrome c peroxidase
MYEGYSTKAVPMRSGKRSFAKLVVTFAIVGLCEIVGAAADINGSRNDAGQARLEELGRVIFLDARLSGDGKVSCATCHLPDLLFTDGRSTSRGASGKLGTRNAPSLIGVAERAPFFWDGRRATLADQVLDPFVNASEHGLKSHQDLMRIIKRDKAYVRRFQEAFPDDMESIQLQSVRVALVAYLSSLKQPRTVVESFLYDGNKTALSAQAKVGLELFRGRAECASCHLIDNKHAPMTDGDFHAVGVGMDRIIEKLPALASKVKFGNAFEIDHSIVNDRELAEMGRFLVTNDPKDIGKFKTPSLVNVARTAPYMHDGSVATLEEAVERELYYRVVGKGKPIALTPEERMAIVAFLREGTLPVQR